MTPDQHAAMTQARAASREIWSAATRLMPVDPLPEFKAGEPIERVDVGALRKKIEEYARRLFDEMLDEMLDEMSSADRG
jgi:hypothetical protein